jgi:acetyl-CoA C-acetyltransferase
MAEKVGIVGFGILEYKGQDELSMWNDEAVFIVSRQALHRAGIDRDELDAVVISTMDGLDGITISNGLLAPAAGAYGKDSIRIENSGIHCIVSGVAAILSKNADCVMVASSDTLAIDMGYVTNSNQDPFFRGPVGFNAVQSYGLLSMDYMRRSNAHGSDFASAASKNYRCGASNIYANIKTAYSAEDVLASPWVSRPLRALDIGALSNGAAALILASEEKAKALVENPVWITGFGVATNSYFGSWKDLCTMRALRKASQKAYGMAGIREPVKEIGFMEINNPFSAFELMAYEALGLCDEKGALGFLRDGVTDEGGALPVNLSGGTLCTHAPNSGGLFRIVQAVMHLQGGSVGTASKNLTRGLVHDSDMGIGAVGGDSHAVLIVETGV